MARYSLRTTREGDPDPSAREIDIAPLMLDGRAFGSSARDRSARSEVSCVIGASRDHSGNRRRAPRLPADFWVRIFGVDEDPLRCSGDISLTGIAFDSDADVGAVGSIQALEIASIDQHTSTVVLARLVRVSKHEELEERRRTTVGFEFIPENTKSQQSLEVLVQHVAFLEFARTRGDPASRSKHALEPPSKTAVVSEIGLHTVQLETSWSPDVGQEVELLVTSPVSESRVPFRGEVVSVAPFETATGETRFRLEMRLESTRDPRRTGESRRKRPPSNESIDLIFGDTSASALTKTGQHDLVGKLSRIPLPALLSMFDMQRLSGALKVVGPKEIARLYIREGRLIDGEIENEEISVRAILARILSWEDGSFVFSNRSIDRPDKVERSTAALLLDLARESDEASRDQEP
jgi:uncharacterized protein DUF4388/PilZ domain-containing protein